MRRIAFLVALTLAAAGHVAFPGAKNSRQAFVLARSNSLSNSAHSGGDVGVSIEMVSPPDPTVGLAVKKTNRAKANGFAIAYFMSSFPNCGGVWEDRRRSTGYGGAPQGLRQCESKADPPPRV